MYKNTFLKWLNESFNQKMKNDRITSALWFFIINDKIDILRIRKKGEITGNLGAKNTTRDKTIRVRADLHHIVKLKQQRMAKM